MDIYDLKEHERAVSVSFTEDTMSVTLRDGRVITLPLDWFPRLKNATPDQRDDWQLLGDGLGIHWPQVDEDLSTRGFIYGYPATEKSKSA